MIKAIIIDDEAHIREDIKEKILEHYAKGIAIVSEADSVASGLQQIEKFEPNLLFLDVDLGDGTGFDLINKSSYKSFDIIFITGFDNHAIKAIKVGALDYILKPLDTEELIHAVDKALASSDKEKHIEKLIEVSSEYFKGVAKKRVILKTSDTVSAIYADDIIYCRSACNYTTFYTQQMEKIVVSKPIKKIEEILTEDVFVRCHQSYIVNKKHVLKYNKKGGLIRHLELKVTGSGRRTDYALKKIFD